jgi:hypothetical protein
MADHCDWEFSPRAERLAARWRIGKSRERAVLPEAKSEDRQRQRQRQLEDPERRPIGWALRIRVKSRWKKARGAIGRARRDDPVFSVNDRVRLAKEDGTVLRAIVLATCVHKSGCALRVAKFRSWAVVAVRRVGGDPDLLACDMAELSEG